MSDRILILDNYDSFTYNLQHIVRANSDAVVDVVLNDKLDINDVDRYSHIILSPGPGLPSEAGIMPALIGRVSAKTRLLGVCLGHQAIAEHYGCTLRNLETVLHGVALPVHVVVDDLLFRHCPKTFQSGRYHSWVVDEHHVAPDIEVTAVDDDGLVMAIRHRTRPVRGVQFHPESVLSEQGSNIIANWLATG